MTHLVYGYPDLLDLYGGYGSMRVLTQRLEDAGEPVTNHSWSTDSYCPLTECDFLFFGCGTERKLLHALDDLLRLRTELEQYIESGRLLLCAGNSAALFADTIRLPDGSVREGLGFVHADAVFEERRRYSEVTARTVLCEAPVVGVYNTSMRLHSNEMPLFTVLSDSTSLLGASEGILRGGILLTQMQGPILWRNPHLTDALTAQLTGSTPACGADWYDLSVKGYRAVCEKLAKTK